MTHRDSDPDRCTRGEQCRGVMELLIIVGIIVWTMTSTSLLMLPALAVAGAALVILAIWDDVAVRRATSKADAPGRRRPSDATRPPDVGSGNHRMA